MRSHSHDGGKTYHEHDPQWEGLISHSHDPNENFADKETVVERFKNVPLSTLRDSYHLTYKIQFLVDFLWDNGLLPNGVFTFPDGDAWETSRTESAKETTETREVTYNDSGACNVCGALVMSRLRQVHIDWHRGLER